MILNDEDFAIIISGLALLQNKYKDSQIGFFNGCFNTSIPSDEIYEKCIFIKNKLIAMKEHDK